MTALIAEITRRAFPGFIIAMGGLGLAAVTHADDQTAGQFIEVPPPPPPVESYDEDVPESPEPEVTIIKREGTTYEEYRHNGRLYMVKIIPTIGLPYFYVDRDGDGLMETRINDRAAKVQVPQWVIFSW